MSGDQFPVSAEEFDKNKPIFEEGADSIMEYLASLTASEIASLMNISGQLAIKSHNLAFEFPYKLTGYPALYAFTGEAYRGLDISTVSKDALQNINDKLRIVSSTYGLLRPEDLIKPYRSEFNKKIAPQGLTPIQFYKQKITIEFVKYIKENKVRDVINLLPADADKCFDWKIIRAFSSVHKVVFQEMTPEGKFKTPIAKKLKELRGSMFRAILENGIETFEELKKVKSEHFIFSSEDSKPLLPVFLAVNADYSPFS